MRDQIFTGEDLADALAAAAASLGVPPERLRYVVLEPQPGAGRGEPASARIAVMLDGGRAPAPSAARETVPRAAPGDAPARLRRIVRELAETAGVELDSELRVEDERLLLALRGEGRGFLHAEGGRVQMALEHLLQRALARGGDRRRLIIECEGFRESRDAWLSERTASLAREVLGDGQSRETEPLNAYDRRIVHLAAGAVPGVRTFSVGDGADRRVTIALAAAG